MPENQDQPPVNSVLGFDFGLKRIGVAVGQRFTGTASPLATLQAQDGSPRWDLVEALIEQWHPDALIVGLPLQIDGSEQAITPAAKRFMNRLSGRYQLPVFMVDERFSSLAAESEIRQLSGAGKNANISVDSVAAKLIVEQWFAAQGDNHSL